MTDLVVTLVFSIVMLIFMIYPSMIISKKLRANFDFSVKTYNLLTIFFTLLFSILTGIFLKYY